MSSGSNKLLRVFGIAFGLAAVVGGVVGQGILRTPGVAAEATGQLGGVCRQPRQRNSGIVSSKQSKPLSAT